MGVFCADLAEILFIEEADFSACLASGGNLPAKFIMAVSVFIPGGPEVKPLSPDMGDQGGAPGAAVELVGFLSSVLEVVILQSAPLCGPSALEEVIPSNLSLSVD